MFTFYSCNLNKVVRWDYGKLRYACHNMGFKLEWQTLTRNWLIYNDETLEVYGFITKIS